MEESERPGKCADPKHDDLMKSLMDEFLASTRNPVGSTDLFAHLSDDAPTHKRREDQKESGEGLDLLWVFAICASAICSLAIAVAFFF